VTKISDKKFRLFEYPKGFTSIRARSRRIIRARSRRIMKPIPCLAILFSDRDLTVCTSSRKKMRGISDLASYLTIFHHFVQSYVDNAYRPTYSNRYSNRLHIQAPSVASYSPSAGRTIDCICSHTSVYTRTTLVEQAQREEQSPVKLFHFRSDP
jgi:hypothetical protein